MYFPRAYVIGFAIVAGIMLLAAYLQRSPYTQPVTLNVPFESQSPYGAWDALHEEACEEMSLIMVRHFLSGAPLTQSGAETEVQDMVAWETANTYGVDVSMKQLGDIAKALYSYHARVVTNVTADAIRRELVLGNPVIIPTSGRALGNPHFEGGQPFYHVLVVTGFTADGFLTNEPGSKSGEKYFYPTTVLIDALHDFTGNKQEIETGPKNALVLER